jgi:hypothetical protein
LLASSSQHGGAGSERERKEENQTVERTGTGSSSSSPAYTLSAVNNKIDCSDKRKPIICINLALGEILKCAAVSYINGEVEYLKLS